MEKIYDIKLSAVDSRDLIVLFGAGVNPPQNPDKYYVKIPRLESDGFKFVSEAEEYGIYNSDHQLIGEIQTKEYLKATVFSIYIHDNKYRESLAEFVELMKRDMKIAGLTILEFYEYGNKSIVHRSREEIYVPKTEAALKRWIEAYQIILEMKSEEAEPDDYDIYIPKHEDFRDRIRKKMKQEYCDKTISRIITAGDADLLS